MRVVQFPAWPVRDGSGAPGSNEGSIRRLSGEISIAVWRPVTRIQMLLLPTAMDLMSDVEKS
jgi:hypothetical protein